MEQEKAFGANGGNDDDGDDGGNRNDDDPKETDIKRAKGEEGRVLTGKGSGKGKGKVAAAKAALDAAVEAEGNFKRARDDEAAQHAARLLEEARAAREAKSKDDAETVKE